MILITQLAGIVQSTVASQAGKGYPSNAVLSRAWLIMMLPHGLITLPIMTPYFTRMSGHAHRGDIDAMRHDFGESLRTVGLFVCLAGTGLIVMAYPFARVFSHNFIETQQMAFVVIAYLSGLIPPPSSSSSSARSTRSRTPERRSCSRRSSRSCS